MTHRTTRAKAAQETGDTPPIDTKRPVRYSQGDAVYTKQDAQLAVVLQVRPTDNACYVHAPGFGRWIRPVDLRHERHGPFSPTKPKVGAPALSKGGREKPHDRPVPRTR